ncbi:hypothetical protein JCM5296_002673 [Sporobolomyces johnsonii]
MGLLVALVLACLTLYARAQTAASFPPLVYSYDGQSAPSSLLNAISTAAEPYNSILEASASDTATSLVGAFPTTATVADTNTPTAASTTNIYSSASPGEIMSTATRAPYTKIGTVDTSMATGTVAATSTKSSRAGKLDLPGRGAVVSCVAALGGVALGAVVFL